MSSATRTGTHDGVPPSIICIHGFLDNSTVWASVIEDLAPLSSVAIAMDLRGAGTLRDAGGPYTLHQAVTDVVSLIDQRKLQRVILIGHSMGAQIAELAAQQRPSQAAALVLMTPTPLAGNQLPPEVVDFLRHCGGDVIAQRSIRQQFARNLSERDLDRLVDVNILMGVEAVEGYFDAFSGGDPSGHDPCAFDGPVLLIAAEDDPVIPADAVKHARDTRYTGAELAMIPQSGHWPHLEQPQRTASAISGFLRGIDLLSAGVPHAGSPH